MFLKQSTTLKAKSKTDKSTLLFLNYILIFIDHLVIISLSDKSQLWNR